MLALEDEHRVAVLTKLAESPLGGGRPYDALIAASARTVQADALLTPNPKYFEPSGGLEIVQM